MNTLLHIIKKEINNLLNEGLSKIIYHYTYIPNLISILKSNRFATSSNLGSDADSNKDKGKFFFFSTQRTKGMSGYAARHGNNVAVVLNGEKLNQKFKGFPTDYWNWSKSKKDYENQSSYITALTSDEHEDRIVTDKPYIENADQYILEIHILTKGKWNTYMTANEVNQIIEQTKKYNIPVWFYDDENNFKLQNKNKAIKNIPTKENDGDNYLTPEREYRDASYYIKDIAPIIILGNQIGGDYNEEYEKIKQLVNKLNQQYNMDHNIMDDILTKVQKYENLSSYYVDDILRSLKADIHNKRGSGNLYIREILKLLVTDMKKWKSHDLKLYLERKFKQ